MVEARQAVGGRNPQRDWNWKQTLNKGGDLLMRKRHIPRELTTRLLFLEGINRLLRASDPRGSNFLEDINHHWSLNILAVYWDEQP